MKKNKEAKKPFFSKLLEAQRVEALKDLKGGAPLITVPYNVTLKYPSDGDEEAEAS